MEAIEAPAPESATQETATPVRRQQIGFLCLALLLVFSSHALPAWVSAIGKHFQWPLIDWMGPINFECLVALLFSALLVCHDPYSYGVRLGHQMRDKWPWVALLCSIPIVLTAIVYPQLPTKPFSGAPVASWLISPLAQDLLFAGFLYHWLSVAFPGKIHARFPANRCILWTAGFFAVWHLPNIAFGIGAFIWFQLVYTFAGACLVGVIRQWTGSLLYITLVHMVVNAIAVYA